jgi:hypothetical protein
MEELTRKIELTNCRTYQEVLFTNVNNAAKKLMNINFTCCLTSASLILLKKPVVELEVFMRQSM